MKDEAAFLSAVLDAPNDDAPRLVYADFLQERGDPRGELIVVQCERERLEREEKTTTLEYRQARWRERSLLARLDGTYRRGFVHRVTLPTAIASELRVLGEDPASALLDTIAIRGDGVIDLDAPTALAIARTLPSHEPLWRDERGLPHPLLIPAVTAVRYGAPTEQMVRDLIEHDTPRLRSVICADTLQFTADALRTYAETASYACLERLELWRVGVTEAAFFIGNAPNAKAFTIVVDDSELRHFWIGADIRNCPALPHVRKLQLDVAPYELDALAYVHREAVHLESWIVPGGIYAEALEEVASGPLIKRLRDLEISFGGRPGFSPHHDIANLVTAPWERLTSLALGNASIGPELAKAPALETLVSLRLFGCKIAGDVENAIRARWPHVRIE